MWSTEKQNTLITGWEKASIVIDFDNIEHYCSYLNKTMSKEQTAFKKKILKEAETLDEEQKAFFYDHMSDDHWRLHDVFPLFHWNSTFVTAYSLLEYYLNYICECLQNELKVNIKVDFIKGQGIERSKNYLSFIWNMGECFSGKHWSEIKDYALIRNRLVHSSGELNLDKDGPKDHKRICDILKKNDSIEIGMNGDFGIGKIKLKPTFVIESIKNYKRFLLNLCDTKKPKLS